MEPFSRRTSRALAGAVAVVAAVLTATPALAARTALKTYRSADGLPQAQVSALAQDAAGFLWVGTLTGGVGRYDGRSWRVWDASNGLPGSSVMALAAGTDGSLFVGTTGGVAVFRRGAFRPVPVGPGPGGVSVLSLLFLADGTLLVGTREGLFVVPAGGGPAVAVPTPEGLAPAEVAALAAGEGGTLWAGTRKGLARVVREPRWALEAVPGLLPPGTVSALLARPAGALLAAVNDGGLFQLDPVRRTVRRIGDDGAPGRFVAALLGEQAGAGAWIGSVDHGAFRWDGEQLTPLGVAQGLPSQHVYTLLEDREGLVWIGTDDGLTKRGPSAFLTLGEEDGFLRDTPIFRMVESREGAIWLAAYRHGLLRMDDANRLTRFTERDGLPSTEVYGISADPSGGVVVATRRGLARVVEGRVQRLTLPRGAPEVADATAFLPDGTLVVASDESGLHFIRDGEARRLSPPLPGRVPSLSVAPDGTLLAAGDGWGAASIRDGRVVELLGPAQGLPSGQVHGLHVDRRGTLWAATDRGLYRRPRTGAPSVLDLSNGLPGSYVYWAGEDPEGHVWAGTNRGVARIAPDGTIRVFTASDGLGASECNEEGFLVDSRGRVFIATEGLSLFLGVPAARRSVAPPIWIEEVRVGRSPVDPSAPLVLPARHEPVTLRYAAPSFLDEAGTRFRYRLRGLSEAFTEAAAGQEETTYGRLGPGTYTFEVTCRTADGREPAASATLSLTVRAPLWQRPAAALLALAAGSALLWALVRFRERRLVAARARLEALVTDRTEALKVANERLEKLAVTDALTGLPNRRLVLEAAAEAFSLARRRGLPCAFAMIDLDHFKAVNDTLGHAAGDALLVAAARQMRGALRAEDHLGRYGGEEFLAVLPATGEDGAARAGERLRAAVASIPADAAGRTPTTSVGMAVWEPSVTGVDELLRRADRALYLAKEQGRDRVVVHGVDTPG